MFLIFVCVFETEFLCVTLAFLELTVYIRLALNCLCLPSAGIKSVHHHTQFHQRELMLVISKRGCGAEVKFTFLPTFFLFLSLSF